MNNVDLRTRRDRRLAPPPLLAPFIRFWPILGTALAGMLLTIAFGILVARTAWWSKLELPVDQYLSLHHVPALNAAALGIAWIFSPLQALTVALWVCAIVLVLTRDPWVTGTFAAMIGINWFCCNIAKLVVHRSRPNPDSLAHPLEHLVNFASYPSGHTCFAASLGVGAIYLLRRSRAQKWAILATAVGVPVVALSRLYIGVHYPSDTIASMVFTASTITAFLAVWNRWVIPKLRTRRTLP